MNTVTRTTNPNGTYRYEINGEMQYKASRVLYTHVSTYTNGAVLFHKTEAAARKATGYKGWTKAGYQAIEDGDAAATVAQHALTIATLAAVLMEQGRLRVSTRLSTAAITTTLDIARGREATRAAGIALAHGHDRDIREAFKTSVPPALAPAAPAAPEGPQCAACGDTSCTAAGAHHTVTVFTDAQTIARPAHIPAGQWDAMSADERTAMGEWEAKMGRTAPATDAAPADAAQAPSCGHCAAHPGWAHGDTRRRVDPRDVCGVCLGSGTPVPPAKRRAPRNGVRVRVNTEYPGQAYKGMTGKVHSKTVGDDGVRYVMVDFRGVTWPFQIHELDVI